MLLLLFLTVAAVVLRGEEAVVGVGEKGMNGMGAEPRRAVCKGLGPAATASLLPSTLGPMRVGEVCCRGESLLWALLGEKPLGPCEYVLVKPFWSFEGVVGRVDWFLVGVKGRMIVVAEEGEAGEDGAAAPEDSVGGVSGRRKGEARGEPKERGEGL